MDKFEEAKQREYRKIKIEVEDRYEEIIGDYSTHEKDIWTSKLIHAEKYLSNTHTSLDIDILNLEITARDQNETLLEFCTIVKEKAAYVQNRTTLFDGYRKKWLTLIENTTTADEIIQKKKERRS